MKTIEISQGGFDNLIRELREVGYNAMSEEDQIILDAWDNGDLRIVATPSSNDNYQFYCRLKWAAAKIEL